MPKKANKIKSKKPKTAPVLKTVKKLATGLVKAMGAKTAKKSQTKAPAKKDKSSKVVTAKETPKVAKIAAAPIKGVVQAQKSGQKAGQKEVSAPKSVAPAPKAPAQPPVIKTKAAKPAKSGTSKASSQGHVHNERMCRESGCENQATTKGYCRLDYIKNWKKIKRKEMILKEGKLNQYIEELVSKYPDKYIEVIRQDLSTEVNFTKVIHDLELDESIDDMEYDGDSIDSLIGSIRKEDDGFDDTEF